MPELIEMWAKVVAYVNEQAQEHIVKVVKSIYHKTTNHRIDLREYVRTRCSGRRLVTKTTAHAQMLRWLGHFHWALGEASDNRSVQSRLKDVARAHGGARRRLRAISWFLNCRNTC